MGAGKINMKIRRFRAFAEKKDLQNVFEELQGKWEIYYVPAYSDAGEISYDNIMDIENLGINFHGSHHGNRQILVFSSPRNACGGRTDTRTLMDRR